MKVYEASPKSRGEVVEVIGLSLMEMGSLKLSLRAICVISIYSKVSITYESMRTSWIW